MHLSNAGVDENGAHVYSIVLPDWEMEIEALPVGSESISEEQETRQLWWYRNEHETCVRTPPPTAGSNPVYNGKI